MVVRRERELCGIGRAEGEGERSVDMLGQCYEGERDGLGTRSSFHYRKPTTVNLRSFTHGCLMRNYTRYRYRLAEICLPKEWWTFVESTCFELDEKYIQSGKEHDLITGQQVE